MFKVFNCPRHNNFITNKLFEGFLKLKTGLNLNQVRFYTVIINDRLWAELSWHTRANPEVMNMVLWYDYNGFMPIFLCSIQINFLCTSHSCVIKTNFNSDKFLGRPRQVYVTDTEKPLIWSMFKLWKHRLE